MKNKKNKFVCRNCGYETKGWMGKCPSCLEWNTFDEEVVETISKSKTHNIKLSTIDDINLDKTKRIDIGIAEMNRVLGGGLVQGSIVLLGGDPGIGKSTILLQLCKSAKENSTILYVSGEESLNQTSIRARRLGVNNKSVYMASDTDLESICQCIRDVKPDIAIIDSIQTIYSDSLTSVPGSVNQIRNAALAFMKTAKTTGTSIFLVGHVTKQGNLAGPKILEHMVDTVLYFEGDRSSTFRILRAVKNRFGSTNEIGVFEMSDKGLVEIKNPSALMLSGRNKDACGSCVIPTIEGTRPLLVEIQALVCATAFGMPRRMSAGIDNNRVTMLMAVLEKVVGLKLYNCDAYVNAAGGIKVVEPACDLAIICSIASSFKNQPISRDVVVMGEVGLTGEIRAIPNIVKRIKEAQRMGFKRAIIPKSNYKQAVKEADNVEIISVDSLSQVIYNIF